MEEEKGYIVTYAVFNTDFKTLKTRSWFYCNYFDAKGKLADVLFKIKGSLFDEETGLENYIIIEEREDNCRLCDSDYCRYFKIGIECIPISYNPDSGTFTSRTF